MRFLYRGQFQFFRLAGFREHFCDLHAAGQLLADIDAYEIYCKDHKDFKNNKTKVTTERILDVYRKCVETGDFL